MKHERNAVGWFEIPVHDLDKAIEFYEEVFDIELERQTLGPIVMAWFPMMMDKPGSPGALVLDKEAENYSKGGPLLYFTAHSGDLNNEIDKVEAAGGKILQPKTEISEEHGYFALILDNQGNKIAIHSVK